MKIINKKTNQILEGEIKSLAEQLDIHLTTVWRWTNGKTENKEWKIYHEVKEDNHIFWQCENRTCSFKAFMPPIYNKCPKCGYRRELSKKKIAELIKKYYGN